MITESSIRVFLVDDQDVVVRGIRDILGEHRDLELVGYQTHVLELVSNIVAAKPDVILLDVKMENFNVFETVEAIGAAMKQKGHKMPSIILVTSHIDAYMVAKAQQLGVAGYMVKEDGLSSTLAGAIRIVYHGGWAYSEAAQEKLKQPTGAKHNYKLSPGQEIVLSLMVDGYSTEEIIQMLDRTQQAIHSHQYQIRHKLGVDTNLQAVVKAIQEKIVPIGRSTHLEGSIP